MKSLTDAYLTQLFAEENRPIDLYEVYLDPPFSSPTYRWAAHPTDQTFGGNVYSAMPLKRTATRSNSDLRVDDVEISIGTASLVLSKLMTESLRILKGKRVVIKRVFLDLLSDAGDHSVVFDGYIDDVKITETAVAAKVVSFLNLAFKYPRRLYKTTCNFTFGDTWCGVNQDSAANKVTGTATGGSTTTVVDTTNLTQVGNYWLEGWIKMTSGDNNYLTRPVKSHTQSTNTVKVQYPFPFAVAAGDTFEIYRTCDKSVSDCEDKFSNIKRFGGFRHVPRRPVA